MLNLREKPEIVRCISPELDMKQLQQDLEFLKKKAVAAGVADIAIIQSEDVIFNPEVRASAAADNGYPSVHWPLHYPKDDLEEAFRAFQKGFFFRVAGGEDMPAYGGGPIADEGHRKVFLRVYEIVTLLESAAFYRGYHLAVGLAAGNCRGLFCAEEKRCWPMVKGRGCIRPNIGRPSMEAAGIDARAMAEKLGWTLPEDKKKAPIAGLVMVA